MSVFEAKTIRVEAIKFGIHTRLYCSDYNIVLKHGQAPFLQVNR